MNPLHDFIEGVLKESLDLINNLVIVVTKLPAIMKAGGVEEYKELERQKAFDNWFNGLTPTQQKDLGEALSKSVRVKT